MAVWAHTRKHTDKDILTQAQNVLSKGIQSCAQAASHLLILPSCGSLGELQPLKVLRKQLIPQYYAAP